MTPDRLQRAFELFDAAVALPENERAAYLARECAADAELREDVESLLSAHHQAEGFLSNRRARTGDATAADSVPGTPVLAQGARLGENRKSGNALAAVPSPVRARRFDRNPSA